MSYQANRPKIERPAIVPNGAAYCEISAAREAREFVFLLVPGFTFLAFAAAIDPLRIANQLAQRPLYRWSVYSEAGEPVESSCGISLNVDGKLSDIRLSSVLFICSGLVPTAHAGAETLASMRRHARFGGICGGICTGAFSLARAGLLHGHKVTLHWENQPAFSEIYPEINVTPALFEEDRKIVTCGGGSAAADMMLSFLTRDHGPAFAGMVADMCLSGAPRPPETRQRASISHFLGSRNRHLMRAIQVMRDFMEAPLDAEEIARRVGTSKRQLERLFKARFQVGPSRYYRNLRLDHGRALLHDTDLAVTEISEACGFSSPTTFARSFRLRFGHAPNDTR
ncbi:GlxA family transcriptional regulator [Roseovarius sp. S4756]|uniref:GlxA family transcriptional regulator n=1 Tax=Roseovarius maritimus TaxID=3342637 RepID=UPI00372B768F